MFHLLCSFFSLWARWRSTINQSTKLHYNLVYVLHLCILFNYTLHNSNVVDEINIKQAKWMHCCYLGNGFVSKVGGYQRTGSLLLLLTTIKAINKLFCIFFASFSSILLTIIAVTVLLSDFHLFRIIFLHFKWFHNQKRFTKWKFYSFFISCLVHH